VVSAIRRAVQLGHRPRRLQSWSAAARLVEREGAGPFDALRAALAAAWPDNEPRLVRWPLTLRFARW